MKLSHRTTATFTLGLLTVGLLTGCATTATSEPAPSPAVSVERLAVSVLDTRLEIKNNTGVTKKLTLGAGCIDPSVLFPKILNAGDVVADFGFCAGADVDVAGKFALGSLLSLSPATISFHAHNPKVGWPSITVDGTKHSFWVNETCVFKAQGEIFEATRRADLSGAKDMVLTWVKASTLPSC